MCSVNMYDWVHHVTCCHLETRLRHIFPKWVKIREKNQWILELRVSNHGIRCPDIIYEKMKPRKGSRIRQLVSNMLEIACFWLPGQGYHNVPDCVWVSLEERQRIWLILLFINILFFSSNLLVNIFFSFVLISVLVLNHEGKLWKFLAQRDLE